MHIALKQGDSTLFKAIDILIIIFLGVAGFLAGQQVLGTSLPATIACVWIANLLMLAGIWASLHRHGQQWEHLGLRSSDLLPVWTLVKRSLIVFVVAISAFVAGAIIAANLVGIPESADMSKYSYLSGNLGFTLLALCSVYCISSFAEEVIYRGFLLTRLQELFGKSVFSNYAAVMISSLVFGLVHSDWGVAGMIQASCMGIALGALFLIYERKLWIMILAHAYMDTILIVQMYLGPASGQ